MRYVDLSSVILAALIAVSALSVMEGCTTLMSAEQLKALAGTTTCFYTTNLGGGETGFVSSSVDDTKKGQTSGNKTNVTCGKIQLQVDNAVGIPVPAGATATTTTTTTVVPPTK